MFEVIVLTIAGWLIEAGVAYSLYRIFSKRLPALLYRILLTWVFLQVINSLASMTTWFIFNDKYTLLLFYLLLIVFSCPFVIWAFLDRKRPTLAGLPKKEALAGGEKTFLWSFGILFFILFIITARHGFMPQWGNVDMANHHNMINAFHAKMLPGWDKRVPFVVQASPALGQAITMWGYCFGYNFLTALISRLTFIETIYVLNFTTCLNMALWLSAPLLLVEWKKTKIWTLLYWVWIAFSVAEWYSAVDRGWLTSIYSLGQCVIVLASIFYIERHREKNGALLLITIAIGSFMVANAHPYNYPVFFLSVLLMALFSGEQRFGKRIVRALGYGAISLAMLMPLLMQSAFKKEFQRIFGFISSGNLAGLLTIRDFEMLTSAQAPLWLGVIGMLVAITVVLITVRSVKKSYIVGVSAVATVTGLYAIYGGGGYLYQKTAFMAPPLFFMLALHLIYDLWQLIYHKWLEKKTRLSSEKWQTYVVAPVLIMALLIAGQIDIGAGVVNIQERFFDVRPMIEPAYYQASKVVANKIVEQGGKGAVNFRTVDGARKMFCARIVRQDDLAQSIPDLPYYAVETTSYEQLVQYIDMIPEKQRTGWEDGWYLVHDVQERDWPQYQTFSRLMADAETVYASGDTVVTKMRLRPDLRSSHIPLAGGVVPVRITRDNTRLVLIEDIGYGTMARNTDAPAVLGMDNPLADTQGDMLFLFQGNSSAQGRITLRILDADGQQITQSILPAFDDLTMVAIPREALGQGAARFELIMEPGNVPASAVLHWMRVYAVPDED